MSRFKKITIPNPFKYWQRWGYLDQCDRMLLRAMAREDRKDIKIILQMIEDKEKE